MNWQFTARFSGFCRQKAPRLAGFGMGWGRHLFAALAVRVSFVGCPGQFPPTMFWG